ncbi:hypothetical protein FBZ82_10277 [Azospirillum brasilense]|uniref:Uncharacterized protein n=1 Tax=Azospirillum brasilense TaxID=192 RepID=A0A560BIM3_AZOBR|nr:hypothetical protein [Azospirillum brasilense]TWA72478.1 hypothetical protein FBZ82_10277 [Azospirillum brasilense]
MPAADLTDLLDRITRQAPTRAATMEVARALGWTTGPSRKGWKVVQPTGYVGGMVVPPSADTAAAEAWFDPEGTERGLAGPNAEFPPYLTSLDTALAAVPVEERATALRTALDRHRAWQDESGRDDAALGRLPAFVIAAWLSAKTASRTSD